jgi:hypothetical protein
VVPKYFCDRQEAGGVFIFLIPRLFGTSREMLSHQSGIDEVRSSAVSARGPEHHRLQPGMHSRRQSPSKQALEVRRARCQN